jgi:hypothetical protein
VKIPYPCIWNYSCKRDFLFFIFFFMLIIRSEYLEKMFLYLNEIIWWLILLQIKKVSARNMCTSMIHLDSLCILIVGVMWCMKRSLTLLGNYEHLLEAQSLPFFGWNETTKNCTKYNSHEKIGCGRRVLYCEDVGCTCTLTS